MRKKLISLILTAAIMLTAFGGCSLFNVNSKRDMMQIVATVKTTGENGTYTDNIYKRDLVSYFNSIGYYYIQQGSSYADTYKQIMDSLINNKIFLHESKRYFNGLSTSLNVNSALTDYLKDWEKVKAEYNVNLSINSLLDSFEKDEITAKKLNTEASSDELSGTGYDVEARAVLTAAENASGVEVTKDNYTDKDIAEYKLNLNSASEVTGSTAETRKKAYSKMVRAIDYYNLLGSATFEEFAASDFYKDELKRQQENIIIENYTQAITDKVAVEGSEHAAGADIILSYDELVSNYNKRFAQEKKKYTASVTEYKSALDALTEETYLLYNPDFDKDFGFVYNILIPFNDLQLHELEIIKNAYSSAESIYKSERKALLKGDTGTEIAIKSTDQRASWIASGYKFTEEDGKIYFDSSLYASEITDTNKGYPFMGTAVALTDTQGGQTKFKVNSEGEKVYQIELTELTFDNIFDEFLGVLGIAPAGFDKSGQYGEFFTGGGDILYSGKTAAAGGGLDGVRTSVRDFMYAYSTDPGSLSGYLGYAVPNDSFVSEFSEAAKQVLDQGEGAFAVVVTDFGLHILYCSAKIEKTSGDQTADSKYFLPEKTAFAAALADEESFSYKFSYEYLHGIQEKYWTRHQESVLNTHNNDTNVKIYAKRYKDLILD